MRIAVVTVSLAIHVRTYVEYLVDCCHQVTVLCNRPYYFGLDVRTIDLRPMG